MRVPFPTRQEVRLVVWVGVLCGLLLAVTLCWGIVHKVNQSDQIVRVAVASADQVERLSAQLDAQAAQARAQEQAAQEQRAQLQQQNQLTQAQYRLTRAQLRALLAYLRSQGIAVPPTLFPPPKAKTSAQEKPVPKDPGAASSTSPQPPPSSPPSSSSPLPSSPAPATPAPTPTASPTPTAIPRPVCTLLPLVCH